MTPNEGSNPSPSASIKPALSCRFWSKPVARRGSQIAQIATTVLEWTNNNLRGTTSWQTHL